jgi:hypothetical protein
MTGWSEGGPWTLAAAAYIDPHRLRHVSSIAGGSYGTFGDNWAAKYLSKADALGGFLALHFEPGFRLMYASIGVTAEYFRETYIKAARKAVNDYDRQILLRPEVETAFCEASAECFAHGSEGLVRDAELLYRSWAFRRDQDRTASPYGKDWMISSFCGNRFGGRIVRNRGRGTEVDGQAAIDMKMSNNGSKEGKGGHCHVVRAVAVAVSLLAR